MSLPVQVPSPYCPDVAGDTCVANFDKLWTDRTPEDSPCGTPNAKARNGTFRDGIFHCLNNMSCAVAVALCHSRHSRRSNYIERLVPYMCSKYSGFPCRSWSSSCCLPCQCIQAVAGRWTMPFEAFPTWHRPSWTVSRAGLARRASPSVHKCQALHWWPQLDALLP